MTFINKFVFILFLFLFSCHHHDHSDHDHSHDSNQEDHSHSSENHDHDHEEHGVMLTQEQMSIMNIQIGQFTPIKINDYIRTTGTLGLPPNAVTSINPRAKGILQNTAKLINGDYVKKGSLIAYLMNSEFIQMQQNYLEAKAKLSFSEQELIRQQSLLDAQAGIKKNLQQIQSEVNILQAQIASLEKQLAYVGINPETVSIDHMIDRTPILSPSSGYLTEVNLHDGAYVTPDMELVEIVDETHLHLELDVFEKDIAKVKEHQPITYTLPALGNQIYQGEVHVVGKEFDMKNKTVRVHGHLEGEQPKFFKDLFLEAKIWLTDETVLALPEGGITRTAGQSILFITLDDDNADPMNFESIRIKTGQSSDGFVAVEPLDPIPETAKIAVQGAYFIQAQANRAELEHSH